MEIVCPQCGSQETSLYKPEVYICDTCEYVFEVDFDEQRFQCIEQRLDELEERLIRIESGKIMEEDDFDGELEP